MVVEMKYFWIRISRLSAVCVLVVACFGCGRSPGSGDLGLKTQHRPGSLPQPGRIHQMRTPLLVAYHPGFRPLIQDGGSAAAVIQVNVGQEDEIQAGNAQLLEAGD